MENHKMTKYLFTGDVPELVTVIQNTDQYTNVQLYNKPLSLYYEYETTYIKGEIVTTKEATTVKYITDNGSSIKEIHTPLVEHLTLAIDSQDFEIIGVKDPSNEMMYLIVPVVI